MDFAVRLNKTYDVDRLRVDMEHALEHGVGHLNRAWRHGDGWKAVALYSVGGSTEPDALRWAGWDGDYRPTPILEECPYFKEIIDEFQCPKFRIRLSRLAPGQAINPHRDRGDTWAVGKARLHIPIVTHDDIWFFVDDQRIIMQEGELWYVNVAPLHSVQNRGDKERVHLIMDFGVNDWLRAQLPPEPLLERLQNFGEFVRYRGSEKLWEWRERVGLTGLRDKARRLLSGNKRDAG